MAECWEDTVLKKPQIDEVTKPYVTHDRFGLDQKLLETQAEATWKALIAKIEAMPHGTTHCDIIKALKGG